MWSNFLEKVGFLFFFFDPTFEKDQSNDPTWLGTCHGPPDEIDFFFFFKQSLQDVAYADVSVKFAQPLVWNESEEFLLTTYNWLPCQDHTELMTKYVCKNVKLQKLHSQCTWKWK